MKLISRNGKFESATEGRDYLTSEGQFSNDPAKHYFTASGKMDGVVEKEEPNPDDPEEPEEPPYIKYNDLFPVVDYLTYDRERGYFLSGTDTRYGVSTLMSGADIKGITEGSNTCPKNFTTMDEWDSVKSLYKDDKLYLVVFSANINANEMCVSPLELTEAGWRPDDVTTEDDLGWYQLRFKTIVTPDILDMEGWGNYYVSSWNGNLRAVYYTSGWKSYYRSGITDSYYVMYYFGVSASMITHPLLSNRTVKEIKDYFDEYEGLSTARYSRGYTTPILNESELDTAPGHQCNFGRLQTSL